MLLHIAIKEFREHLLSARFALTMGVLLLLVTATVLALSADYRKQVVMTTTGAWSCTAAVWPPTRWAGRLW